jgi:hypothetical protein
MDGRRRAVVVTRGGAEQNPAYRPTRPPLGLLANGLVEYLERGTEFLA